MAWPNTCEQCHEQFESQKEWAKYCSSKCRNAAARERKRDQRERDAEEQRAAAAELAAHEEEGRVPGRLEARTLEELDRVGRTETALGEAVLIMARVIDSGLDQPIASIATAMAQHRTALLAATAGSSSVNPTGAQPTQLQEWRQKRERANVANRNRRGRPAN